MSKFKVGDKVVCVDVNAGDIGWENQRGVHDFTTKRPVKDMVYTVDRVSPNPDTPWIGLAERGSYANHTDHFKHYKVTNKDRMERRRKELCLNTK